MTASPALPPAAVDCYESLRAQATVGGSDRTGLAAVCYHGMVRGLAMVTVERPAVTPHRPPSSDMTAPASDRAVVRQLANMILQLQPERSHAW